MKKIVLSALVVSLVALPDGFGIAGAGQRTQAQNTSHAQTQTVVDATNVFLKSLSTDQLKKAQFSFTPQKTATLARFQRTGPGGGQGGPGDSGGPGGPGDGQGGRGNRPDNRPGGGRGGPGGGAGMGPRGGFVGEQYGQAVWSNYPVSDVPRPGLQLGSLSDKQRSAAMHLLQVVLSPNGYQKVLEIMGSDQALHDAGTPFASGKAVYTIGVFGMPSTTTPWMLQYGGHHLGLNILVAGEHGVMTPTLTGAQPSLYSAGGKTVRAFAQENDKAFALLGALDESQRKQSILNYRIDDLVLGPGHAGETIVPEGLKGSAMNAQQQRMLLDVISEWSGIISDAYAKPRMDEIKAGLKDTYFAWSGPTTHEPGRNGSAYYRIQGPKVVIEFSPQGVGGDSTLHVHTMYRDPTNDYGASLIAAATKTR